VLPAAVWRARRILAFTGWRQLKSGVGAHPPGGVFVGVAVTVGVDVTVGVFVGTSVPVGVRVEV